MSLFIWAQIISIVTVVSTIFGLFQKEKWKIMILFTLANFSMLITYIFLGSYLGAVLMVGAILRTFVYFLYSKDNKKIPAILFSLFELYFVVTSLFMFKSIFELFVILNMFLVSFTTWQNNMSFMRIGYLLSSILLISFNVFIGAYVSIVSEVILLVWSIVAVVKYDFKNKIDDIVIDFYKTISPAYDLTIDEKNDGLLIYSPCIEDELNNFIYYKNPKNYLGDLKVSQNILKDLDRQACVYLPSVKGKDIYFIIENSKKHKILFHDVWMKLVSGQNTRYKKCLLNGVSFKKCTEKDKKDIIEIFVDGFVNVASDSVYKYEDAYAKQYEKKLNDEFLQNNRIQPYMALLDGKPIGLLFMYRSKYNAYVCQITTLEKYRRQGVASALIRYAIGKERQEGIMDFYLVTEKYTYLELFYMKNNFVEVAEGFGLDVKEGKRKKVVKS